MGDRCRGEGRGEICNSRIMRKQSDMTIRIVQFFDYRMEIVRTLSRRVRELPSVTVVPFAFVRDLVRTDERVAAVQFVREGKWFTAVGRVAAAMGD